MKTLRPALGYLIAGVLLYFLIKPFGETHTALKDTTFQIHYGWLVCSFGAILFYWSAYLSPLATILGGLTQKHVPFRDAFTLFHLANITRYLPGRIWGVVRLLSLSHHFGLSKTAVGSSLTLHVGVETALGGLIAMTLLFSHRMRETATEVLEMLSGQTLLLTVVVIGSLASILLLIPQLAHHTRQFIETLTPLLKTARVWGNVLIVHIFLWLCQGFAFFLFVKSFAPVLWADVGVLTACFAFAWIVGFLSFLTPGGLGVREGLLALLLANYMPAPQATRVALMCRVWMLSAEMLLAAVAYLLNRKSRCPRNT